MLIKIAYVHLQVAMGTLSLRLSYHDMRMFASMLQSLPAQARVALSGIVNSITPFTRQTNCMQLVYNL